MGEKKGGDRFREEGVSAKVLLHKIGREKAGGG